jgi:hypothetical protein
MLVLLARLFDNLGTVIPYEQLCLLIGHKSANSAATHVLRQYTSWLRGVLIAAFETPADAVRAAFDIREAVDELNRDRPQRDFILKIGVHRGASIAVTLNERLDYFGQTVNIAARMQNLADADEICITEDVHDAEGVAEIIAPTRWQRAKRNSGASARPFRSIIWLDGHPSLAAPTAAQNGPRNIATATHH